jgi:outer membrane protein assembly factor BamB
MDGLVYFSTLEGRTFALNAKRGKKVWEFGDGQYSPLVADVDRVYLVGVKRLYALEER